MQYLSTIQWEFCSYFWILLLDHILMIFFYSEDSLAEFSILQFWQITSVKNASLSIHLEVSAAFG